jgi:hypothetical protein
MEYFTRKTSIAGFEFSNWLLVLVAIVAIGVIYQLVAG